MNKLKKFFDQSLLKWLVGFTLIFIPLYPKLPSIHITQTWVYIRFEDFLISLLVIVWLILFIRKKITLPSSEGWGIYIYWIIGLVSLMFSLLFIGSHLANFFPKIAALQYVRRIEYMVLFLIAYATIKSKKDILDYFIIVCISLIAIDVYGFGQKYYLFLWHQFPSFFVKNPFCFPSFQTGNEEFAKGIPLCLPADARMTSTFGGHYDFAAFLVIVLPLLIGSIFAIKKKIYKIGIMLLTSLSVCMLIFTASRISFVAYLIGVSATLLFIKQKKFIPPFFIISILILISFSGSTAKRFLETIRVTSIVTNNQGKIIGEAENTLPTALQKKISKNPVVVEAPPPTQNLPVGSGFIALPPVSAPVATSVAVVTTKLPTVTSKKLNLTYGGVQISTISGSFLIQKAFVYDISFTTRFQGEWPNAWKAFMRNPLLGSGYSSITLASDNDFLRALGETGFLGLGSFLFIFILLGIFISQSIHTVKDSFPKVFALGIAGGIIGLFINATLIDVFEASKVAEPLWLLIGISAGGIALYQQKMIAYKKYLYQFFTSNILIGLYLFIGTMVFFLQSISNFFVGDDFTWLKWSASSTISSVIKSFTDAGGFFYRPVPKVIMFLLYTVFSFQPEGYHFFNFILHWLMALGVYFLAQKIFSNKFYSFTAAFLFLLLPSHGENVFWVSTLSANVSSVFMLYGLIVFIDAQKRKSIILYSVSLILQIFALFSYEMAVVYPLLIIAVDLYFTKQITLKKRIFSYSPFILLAILYIPLRSVVHALPPGGDYAINLKHFIPNFFGNLLGYGGIFISGETFFTEYTMLRTVFRSYSIIVTVFGTGFFVLVILFGYLQRKKIIALGKQKNMTATFFLIAFMIISLLPFIGMGNISERYGYLSSAAFVILLVQVLSRFRVLFTSYSKYIFYTFLCILITAILAWYSIRIIKEHNDWNNSGKTTYNTLSLLRYNYVSLPPRTELIFINVPIKKNQAWIFPVGLDDGIWFIYRDPSIAVIKVSTLKQAYNERTRAQSIRPKVIIFSFDDKANISEIE